MNWFEKLFVDTDSIGHIVLIYSLVIAVGVFLGRMKIGGKKQYFNELDCIHDYMKRHNMD